jgi:hypothetical protein
LTGFEKDAVACAGGTGKVSGILAHSLRFSPCNKRLFNRDLLRFIRNAQECQILA